MSHPGLPIHNFGHQSIIQFYVWIITATIYLKEEKKTIAYVQMGAYRRFFFLSLHHHHYCAIYSKYLDFNMNQMNIVELFTMNEEEKRESVGFTHGTVWLFNKRSKWEIE